MHKGYNPNQPRVPAGSSKGGQWAKREAADKIYSTVFSQNENIPVGTSSRNAKNRRFPMSLRRPASHILTDEEIESIKKDAVRIGIDPSILRFNKAKQTSFNDDEKIIEIAGDVLPDLNSKIPRDRMSVMAVLAHEYYGHYKHHPSEYPIGDWRDEFRASYEAAIKTPNLSIEDRTYLMLDAYERAKEVGVYTPYDEKSRRIIYGF